MRRDTKIPGPFSNEMKATLALDKSRIWIGGVLWAFAFGLKPAWLIKVGSRGPVDLDRHIIKFCKSYGLFNT